MAVWFVFYALEAQKIVEIHSKVPWSIPGENPDCGSRCMAWHDHSSGDPTQVSSGRVAQNTQSTQEFQFSWDFLAINPNQKSLIVTYLTTSTRRRMHCDIIQVQNSFRFCQPIYSNSNSKSSTPLRIWSQSPQVQVQHILVQIWTKTLSLIVP